MNLVALCVLTISSLGVSGRGQILEFSSERCGPCQQMAPLVAKLEREGLPIHSIDVDADQDTASQYRIATIPAFVLIVDGKEVERLTGSQSESRIRQMLARIPSGESRRSPNGGNLPIQLGEAAPIPRPGSLGQSGPRTRSRETQVTEPEGSRLWPFSKPKTPAKADVRGNDPDPMPPAAVVEVLPASPMDASARLRIVTGDSEVKGSGTVIESRPGRTIILTCSHVLRGANEDTRVEVDLFRDGKPVTYLGSIIGGDPEADVGLISIRTSEDIYPAIPVASLGQTPKAGAQVSSIGCGGGEAPSREQLRVTEVNRYKGPDTVVCTGTPIQGRSGGGLFDADGVLVGVCFAADETGKRGVYCGLRPIHDLLNKYSLAHLAPADVPDQAVAQTELPIESAPESKSGAAAPMPRGTDTGDAGFAFDLPRQQAAAPAAEAYAADDAEVMVVIRSRTGGPASDKVIFIHKPSRQFLNFVEGELGDSPAVGAAEQPAPEARITRTVKPGPSTRELQTTGLKSQATPRPYVRSVE